jgi:hypothetical protein
MADISVGRTPLVSGEYPTGDRHCRCWDGTLETNGGRLVGIVFGRSSTNLAIILPRVSSRPK